MTVSFAGASTLGERGAGPGNYPVWSVEGVVVVKKIPGGNKNVIQVIGIKRPRLALTVKCTAAQLAALRAKIGVTGTLVFHFETTTATLESVENAAEQGAGHEVYFATLNLIRSDASFGSTPSTARITESSDTRVTESGDIRIVE